MTDYRVTVRVSVTADNPRQAVLCALQCLALDGERAFRVREDQDTAQAVLFDPVTVIAAI